MSGFFSRACSGDLVSFGWVGEAYQQPMYALVCGCGWNKREERLFSRLVFNLYPIKVSADDSPLKYIVLFHIVRSSYCDQLKATTIITETYNPV